jgi:hypothetical protein
MARTPPEVGSPVFSFLGRHDRVVDPRTSMAYFDKLVAPSKRLLWFGRVVPRAPEKFHGAVAELVRPVSQSANVRL